jgi:hypothetical protein
LGTNPPQSRWNNGRIFHDRQKTDDWRVAVARQVEGEAIATLEKIGRQLQFKLAKIVAEPLPAEQQGLLSALENRIDERK